MAFKRNSDTETQGQKIRTNFHRKNWKNKVCERKQGELSCGSQTEHKGILMIVKMFGQNNLWIDETFWKDGVLLQLT